MKTITITNDWDRSLSTATKKLKRLLSSGYVIVDIWHVNISPRQTVIALAKGPK